MEAVKQLDQEVSTVISQAWADNTLKTRNSQWSKYFKFCIDYGFCALPAEPSTIARFLVFLSRHCKYSTINNYLSAVITLHKFYGRDVDFRQFYIIKLVLKGLKRQLGTAVSQSRPFSLGELAMMYSSLDMSLQTDRDLWSAVIFSFRTLLRKSNVVPDRIGEYTHVVRRKDIEFHDWGVMVHVSSTKTIQHRQYVLHIPIHYVSDTKFCAATAIRLHFLAVPGDPNDPLFLKRPFGRPYLYSDLLMFVKRLALNIGVVNERVGCHSLRRSGAGFMHSIGVPLEDIMSAGDWHSMAVLLYLSTPMSRKHNIQEKVSGSLTI